MLSAAHAICLFLLPISSRISSFLIAQIPIILRIPCGRREAIGMCKKESRYRSETEILCAVQYFAAFRRIGCKWFDDCVSGSGWRDSILSLDRRHEDSEREKRDKRRQRVKRQREKRRQRANLSQPAAYSFSLSLSSTDSARSLHECLFLRASDFGDAHHSQLVVPSRGKRQKRSE